MEWLNEPAEVKPQDVCSAYICWDRKSDNQGPCIIQLCIKKYCGINK